MNWFATGSPSRQSSVESREARPMAKVTLPPSSGLRAALELRKAGDRAGAEAALRQVAASDPDDALALTVLGLWRFEAGDADEAQACFERLTQLAPEDAEAWARVAHVRQSRGAFVAAAEAFGQATRLRLDDPELLTGLSQTQLACGEKQAAADAARAALQLAPSHADGHLALAAALSALKRPEDAARSYQSASQLAPGAAPAHLGLAIELLKLGRPADALPSAQRAVALDEASALAWHTLGVALRRLGRLAPAAAALERCLQCDPRHPSARLELGLAYMDLDQPRLAEQRLLEALAEDETDKEVHASLSTLYGEARRYVEARRHAQRALELDPTLIAPRQMMARILAREGREAEAKHHRDLAYGARNLIVAEAAAPRQRVLVLSTTGLGNVPDRHLLPGDAFTRLYWFIEYASPGQAETLPTYDVVFNAIGDEDEAGPTAASATAFVASCSKPVLNRPDRVARTRRDLAQALFEGIDDLVVPQTIRVDREVAATGAAVAAAIDAAGLEPPLLLRPAGSHGGERLVLATTRAEIEAFASPAPVRGVYATRFHDFRSADGLYRKHRMIFVGGQPFPYHLAIGEAWKLHYDTSGTANHSARLAEERRFLEDPRAALGERASTALAALGRRLELDYAGADFAVLDDGRALLFEANATMLVHPEADPGPLVHKNPYVRRILEAFWRRLRRS
jgi:tetratricopeptide (TPR) repeat protein